MAGGSWSERDRNRADKESGSTTEVSVNQYNFFDPPIELRQVYSPSAHLLIRRVNEINQTDLMPSETLTDENRTGSLNPPDTIKVSQSEAYSADDYNVYAESRLTSLS